MSTSTGTERPWSGIKSVKNIKNNLVIVFPSTIFISLPKNKEMSAAELRRKVKELHAKLGASRPSSLRKNECERMIGIYEEILSRQSTTPLAKETHHLPPREIVESAVSGAGIEIPVVPAKRETPDRKKPTKAKDIVIVHETGDAEAVEVKPAHVKKEKVVKEKVEKPVEAAEPAEKKKRVLTDEHKAKMKAGRDALKAAKLAESGSAPAPASPPASGSPASPPAPSKLPSGVRPL
jgi:hypothetical protein